MNNSINYKLLLVGDKEAGKSVFLLRFTEPHFRETFITKIGIDFKTTTLTINDWNIKLQIWDTAGQEKISLNNANIFHSRKRNYASI